MPDIISKEKRSRLMAQVKSRDTKPEIAVRSLIHRAGFRFRLHRNNLPGKPDIVLTRYKTIVFVHGCFWHQHTGCKRAKLPSTNFEFWERKLRNNQIRDEAVSKKLNELGWKIKVIWECSLKEGTNELIAELEMQKRQLINDV